MRLVHAALEHATRRARASAAKCVPGDPTLRAGVSSLPIHEQASRFIDTPAYGAACRASRGRVGASRSVGRRSRQYVVTRKPEGWNGRGVYLIPTILPTAPPCRDGGPHPGVYTRRMQAGTRLRRELGRRSRTRGSCQRRAATGRSCDRPPRRYASLLERINGRCRSKPRRERLEPSPDERACGSLSAVVAYANAFLDQLDELPGLPRIRGPRRGLTRSGRAFRISQVSV